jgi:hypothetical protein
VHRDFAAKLDFAGNAVRNLFALFIVKSDIDLEFSCPFVKKSCEGHELRTPRISGRTEPLEDPPKLIIFGENILLDAVATEEGGNFR